MLFSGSVYFKTSYPSLRDKRASEIKEISENVQIQKY